MKNLITNAFSINMLTGNQQISFKKVDKNFVAGMISNGGFTSAVGHQDTAVIFSNVLGQKIKANRITITLDGDFTLVVGQYSGPRLQEGATVLPDDAKIDWWVVESIR